MHLAINFPQLPQLTQLKEAVKLRLLLNEQSGIATGEVVRQAERLAVGLKRKLPAQNLKEPLDAIPPDTITKHLEGEALESRVDVRIVLVKSLKALLNRCRPGDFGLGRLG